VKVALRLLLLLGFGALGLFVLREVPRDVTLVYAVEDAPAVRKVDVEILKGDGVLRHAELRFPTGAPAQIRQDVKLKDGDYRVVVRVWRASAAPVRTVLPLTVAENGPVVLTIGDPAARID